MKGCAVDVPTGCSSPRGPSVHEEKGESEERQKTRAKKRGRKKKDLGRYHLTLFPPLFPSVASSTKEGEEKGVSKER